MNRCLKCTKPVSGTSAYHKKCAEELYGSETPPILEVHLGDIAELAKVSVHRRLTVPGVQSKLSLDIESEAEKTDKLTIVGLWGRYILKPPSGKWPGLPENEHCTMLMAESADIETVPFGLVRLASGELSYITKRIDRSDQGLKIAMEDMCQLSGKLTEDKYKGSHEQIAHIIRKHSENPLFDLTRFFELVLFSYLTGNGDMHLKNFSLYKDPVIGWKLAPAYDLLSTRLVIPKEKDPEELALTLTGKRSKFKRASFEAFGQSIGLNDKQVKNIFERFSGKEKLFCDIVDQSFLPADLKKSYAEIISSRFLIFS